MLFEKSSKFVFLSNDSEDELNKQTVHKKSRFCFIYKDRKWKRIVKIVNEGL